MSIYEFERQLKKINPDFNIRQRGYQGMDIAGVFLRNDFRVTMSHGHVPLNTFKYIVKRGDQYSEKIKKRGRAELARILRSRRDMSNDQSVRLKYGEL